MLFTVSSIYKLFFCILFFQVCKIIASVVCIVVVIFYFSCNYFVMAWKILFSFHPWKSTGTQIFRGNKLIIIGYIKFEIPPRPNLLYSTKTKTRRDVPTLHPQLCIGPEERFYLGAGNCVKVESGAG